ncbi:MAG: uroporphyrinogen-III synthase [Acidobacteria bacterium]|nr:uroporphyrinogen-III synthase [Acidobacteriota bacterium]
MVDPVRAIAGKRVVVTRAAAQAIDLLKALQHAGAIPILLPVIQILPPNDFSQLDNALKGLAEFDWILFTSQNAVRIVHERMDNLQIALARSPAVGAVGRTTAEEATAAGFSVAHISSRPLGSALVEELGSKLRGANVLLPRSDRANPDVVIALEKHRARVTEVVAYRTISLDAQSQEVISKAMNADAVLFFSPSAVSGFDDVCGAGKLAEFSVSGIVLASGPVTLTALHEKGISNARAAAEPSVARIIEALANSFEARDRRVSSEAN